MTAIKLKGLKKSFGSKVAVNGIDLEIAEGELFGLLGVNGAGKTTTIRMLSCLSRPSDGEAWVNGHSILTEPDQVKSIIAISPQETSVAPNLTSRENLEFMAQIYGNSKASAKEKADRIIKEYSLGEVEHRRAKLLSGGWQRRLSIAMAMISDPKVLFLDEPTLGLDVLARRELWRTIEGMKGRRTVILTTHYLEEAEALCDRIAVMVDGDVRAVGTAAELKELTSTESLEEAFIKIAQRGDVK
ncbi:MAG: ATP-binding cassette domain-containing protein [Clostridia bacterium]|nr:ATP-binding cassette domain-containing protein [Clostridia bacterium]